MPDFKDFFGFERRRREAKRLISEEEERTRLLIKEKNDYENLIKDTDLTSLLKYYSTFKNKKYYGYVLEKIKRYDDEKLINDLYEISISSNNEKNMNNLYNFGKKIKNDEEIDASLKQKIFDAYSEVNRRLDLQDKNYRLLYDPTLELHKTTHHSNLSAHPLHERGTQGAKPGSESAATELATPEFKPVNNDLYEDIPEEGGKRSRRKRKHRKHRKTKGRKTIRRKSIRRKSKRRQH